MGQNGRFGSQLDGQSFGRMRMAQRWKTIYCAQQLAENGGSNAKGKWQWGRLILKFLSSNTQYKIILSSSENGWKCEKWGQRHNLKWMWSDCVARRLEDWPKFKVRSEARLVGNHLLKKGQMGGSDRLHPAGGAAGWNE